MMTPDEQTRLQAELLPGETLLWHGRPQQPVVNSATLPLFLIVGQQLQNGFLNPGGGVAVGEEFPKIVHSEADFVLLVGFRFPEDVKDLIHVQFPGLAQFLQLDGLRERGGAVLALHGFQKVMLFLTG